MSAFDDEFGLFGDEAPKDEDERRPTLGARRIASTETIIDEIEPEDEPSPRRRRSGEESRPIRGGPPRSAPGARRDRPARPPIDPAVSQARATELLAFLAKKLVSRPDDVVVQTVEGDRGPIVELEVHPDDLGKVIGRSGRVAQALRTLVRAGAESRITVDIVDTDDDELLEEDAEHAGNTEALGVATAPSAMEADDDEFDDDDDDELADGEDEAEGDELNDDGAEEVSPKGTTVDR